MTTAKDLHGTQRPDAQAFDEVRVLTFPRWKTSEMSGDEWRISGMLQFWRNGTLIREARYRNIETALRYASAEHGKAVDDGLAYFATETTFCDQEGCHDEATVFYRRLFAYCNEGHKTEDGEHRRQFCETHKTRGDCALDDADVNYERT